MQEEKFEEKEQQPLSVFELFAAAEETYEEAQARAQKRTSRLSRRSSSRWTSSEPTLSVSFRLLLKQMVQLTARATSIRSTSY